MGGCENRREMREGCSARLPYRLDAGAGTALDDYLGRRIRQPNFANARSVRNALDRARLRQASRLFADAMQGGGPSDTAALTQLCATDIRASRVFDAPPQRPS